MSITINMPFDNWLFIIPRSVVLSFPLCKIIVFVIHNTFLWSLYYTLTMMMIILNFSRFIIDRNMNDRNLDYYRLTFNFSLFVYNKKAYHLTVDYDTSTAQMYYQYHWWTIEIYLVIMQGSISCKHVLTISMSYLFKYRVRKRRFIILWSQK